MKKPDANARIDVLIDEINASLEDAGEQINDRFAMLAEGINNGFTTAQKIDQGQAMQIAALEERLAIAENRAQANQNTRRYIFERINALETELRGHVNRPTRWQRVKQWFAEATYGWR